MIKKIIIDEFKGKTKFSKEIKFLRKSSRSPVYVSKRTGLIHHKSNLSTEDSLNLWSKKIFSNKISYKKLKYTSDNLTMRARHFYCANFIKEQFSKKNYTICDFGAGQGNFIKEMTREINFSKIFFTEHSKENIIRIKSYLKAKKKKYFYLKGSIEETKNNRDFKNIQIGTLLWTLCNCINPIDVLNSINKTLTNNGFLIIGESSRILIPFKKSIYNYFNKRIKTNNSHPWHFSINSLSNLLEVTGFRIIKTNRYNDENDLIVLAQKRPKKIKPKFKLDNPKKIISFFKKWIEISDYLKKENINASNHSSKIKF